MKKLGSAVCLSLLFACGGSETGGAVEPVTTPTTDEPTAEAPMAMLGLAEMTVHFEGTEGMRVHADGGVEANIDGTWTLVANIKDDTIWSKDGDVLSKVDADGNVSFPKSEMENGIKLTGETLTFGPTTLALDAEGWVTGAKPGSEGKIQVKGATDAASKRTALLVITNMMMRSGADKSDAPTEAPAAEASPPTP